jgi:hypothetical protein
MSTRLLLVWGLLAALAVGPSLAQAPEPILLEGIERIEFDRPEAWAMKYFASIALPTGFGPPRAAAAGSVSLEIEGGLVPNLGEEKRRVGFIGSKVEDLNRTNLFGRVRVGATLKRNLTLALGVTPPVEVNGVTPALVAASLAVPVQLGPRWRLGLGVSGQTGSLRGDLTCPGDVVGSSDPAVNPDDCREASDDELSVETLGLELSVARVPQAGRFEPYVAVSAHRIDASFQVRARYSAFLDRMRLEASGTTVALAGGVTLQMSDALTIASEVFYSPLEVVRDPLRGTQTDELVNARILARYRVR